MLINGIFQCDTPHLFTRAGAVSFCYKSNKHFVKITNVDTCEENPSDKTIHLLYQVSSCERFCMLVDEVAFGYSVFNENNKENENKPRQN